VRQYQKGQTVEASSSRSTRSASASRSASSSWRRIRSRTGSREHPKGSIVRGLVREVEAKGAIVDLGGGIDGYLRAPSSP
jgi:small subunit ribosomal protein S1